MAVLPLLLEVGGGSRATGMQTLRPAVRGGSSGVSRLSRWQPCLVPVCLPLRWTGPARPDASEVRQDALIRRGRRAMDARGVRSRPSDRVVRSVHRLPFRRPHHMGSAGEATQTGARVRPGRDARPGFRRVHGEPPSPPAGSNGRNAAPGDAVGCGSKTSPSGSILGDLHATRSRRLGR